MGTGAAFLFAAILAAGPGEGRVSDIRKVDFGNFTYRVWGDHEVQARDGQGISPKDAEPSDPIISSIKTVYGDLTGDGRDEAAVVVYFTAGGNATFSEGFVYTVKLGSVQVLDTFESGPNPWNRIWTVAISKGELVVERELGSCHACVDEIVTTRYRWDGTHLRPSRVTRRKWDGTDPPTWPKEPK